MVAIFFGRVFVRGSWIKALFLDRFVYSRKGISPRPCGVGIVGMVFFILVGALARFLQFTLFSQFLLLLRGLFDQAFILGGFIDVA